MIIFYILTTLSLSNVWTLLGENCCWSLLGLKGLTIQFLKQCLHVICTHSDFRSSISSSKQGAHTYQCQAPATQPRMPMYNQATQAYHTGYAAVQFDLGEDHNLPGQVHHLSNVPKIPWQPPPLNTPCLLQGIPGIAPWHMD